MCGIAGRWVRDSGDPMTHQMARALRSLERRGPDDCDQEFHRIDHGALTLGHTRLAIIDLSAGGHQPMHRSSGRYSLVYNGEIYNYRELRDELESLGQHFVSESDSEVLLAAWIVWGAEALPRLTGMFAFAVFDACARTLTLVRDGFGIKPLFYRSTADGFAFASDIRALLELVPEKPKLDLQRAYDYLVFGSYDDGERTFFASISHLLPGHVLTLSLATGVSSVTRWWWPDLVPTFADTFEQAAENVRELFLKNVRVHLRSDVPLGAALSGGIDSSAIVCAMRLAVPDMPVHTVSYAARESVVDEEPWADVANAHVRAIPHKVVASPHELAADIDDMISAQGEPFGSTSIYAQYRVFKLAREHGITVMLEGQGADELFAGYSGYPGPVLRQLLEQGRPLEAAAFAGRWSRWPGRTAAQAILSLGQETVPPLLRGAALSLVGRTPEPRWLDIRMLRDAGVNLRQPRLPAEFAQPGRRLAAALRAALLRRGLPALLRHADRNSMRWSIESRVPFLTTELAEYVLRLPEGYLVSTTGETKRLFRAAMRGIVPDSILDRRDKVGFATPEQEWLSSLGASVDRWLDQDVVSAPVFRQRETREELAAIVRGKKAFTWQAWRFINFAVWHRLFF